jgi:hypothetical protein
MQCIRRLVSFTLQKVSSLAVVSRSSKCEGTACGNDSKGDRYMGVCYQDGCDFNSYRMGERSFFGNCADFERDTSKPRSAVTQFFTHDNTDTGDLSEIRRCYVQEGKVVPNSIQHCWAQALAPRSQTTSAASKGASSGI